MSARCVSLAHLTLLDLDPPSLIEVAASAGFDAVGLRLRAAGPDDGPYPLVDDLALRRATLARLQETRMEVLDVEVLRLEPGTEVGSFDRVLDTAAQLGARYLLVNGYDPDSSRLTERFDELCARATPLGLRPALEFIPYSEVTTLADARRVVQGSSGGLLIDPIHLQRSGGVADNVRALEADRLDYVQLCDAPRATPPGGVRGLIDESRHRRLPPGSGELALSELIAALPPSTTAASVEAPSDELRVRLGTTGFARRLRVAADPLVKGLGSRDLIGTSTQGDRGCDV